MARMNNKNEILEGRRLDKEQLQELYIQKEYYWGKEPNQLVSKVLDFIPIQRRGKKLADVGAGEGRDSVFFAKEGFDVLAVDIAPAGLQKAVNLAKELNFASSSSRIASKTP